MFTACKNLMRNLAVHESSQGIVECGFVVALVAVAVIASVKLGASLTMVAKVVELILSSI